MIPLDLSGLNLHFDKEKKKIILIDENKETQYEPLFRKLKDVRALFCGSTITQSPETIIYSMFRGIWKKKHDKTIKENKLRYDITIIEPAIFGEEYVKTAGHYHPIAKDGLSYPEVYEVIKGEGLFFLQKKEEFAGNKKLKSVFVLGKEGDLIFIPPNYGHITINTSNEFLYMANWVSSAFESEYKEIKERKGAIFYILQKNGGGFKLEKNDNYADYKAQPVFASPKKASFFGFEEKTPMYEFIESPEKLMFLNDPTVCPDLDYD